MGREEDHRSKRRKHSHGERSVERRRDEKLPFNARLLTKDDMDEFQGVFAKYLKEKKDIRIEDISSTEAYARFKSFVHKWNERDLSSKYYDPENNRRHSERRSSSHDDHGRRRSSHDRERRHSNTEKAHSREGVYPRSSKIVGPTLPTREDFQLQKEQRLEDAEAAASTHHAEQKHQRRLEKERLKELLPPRADPGTKERRLEKKAEISAAHRSFRDKSPEVTISDSTLMGGDDIKADLLRQKRIEAEKEARRDEVSRAREAEKMERRRELARRENETMEMLKKLAQERLDGAT